MSTSRLLRALHTASPRILPTAFTVTRQCSSRVHRLPSISRSFTTATPATVAPSSASSSASSASSPSSPLTRAEVESRVLEVVKKFDKVEASKVTASSVFSSDLGLDSLDAVELVMAFEDEFDIEISDQDADKIQSTQDAINFIAQHPKAK